MENRFKLARTLHNQHGSQSTKEVECESGITKSLIEDLESNAGKPRNVSYLKVKRLAEHYGVSSDYLLGLSSTPSVNEDIQVACKVTGLSGEAIHCLQDIASAFAGFSGKPRHEYAVKTNYEYSLLWIMEQIIISDRFKSMLGRLGQYFLYGGALPDEALNKEPVDLSAKEYAKFNDWLEWNGMTWIKMGDVAEMYLQQAADELKAIYKKALEDNMHTGRADNGKH